MGTAERETGSRRLSIWAAIVVAAVVLGALAFPGAQQARAAATCTDVRADVLPVGTLAPDGSPLTPPLSDWEQVSAQCSPAAVSVSVTVPDCQPGCGPPSTNHRQIVEWWAHAPAACSLGTTNNPDDTITCPGKADGRICMYLRKSPGPGSPTAISSEGLHVVFPDATTFDATPQLASAAGCGPGDHPHNDFAPQVAPAGRVQSGTTLSCSKGSWSGDMPQTYSYQWLKDGIDIRGAMDDHYDVQPLDAGSTISCRVTAVNPENDSTDADSNNVVVEPLPTGPGGGTGPGSPARLVTTKTADTTSPIAGQIVTFTVTVRNVGGSFAPGVYFFDTVRSRDGKNAVGAFLGLPLDCDVDDAYDSSFFVRQVVCSVGDLPPGAAVTTTLKFRFIGGTEWQNHATAAASGAFSADEAIVTGDTADDAPRLHGLDAYVGSSGATGIPTECPNDGCQIHVGLRSETSGHKRVGAEIQLALGAAKRTRPTLLATGSVQIAAGQTGTIAIRMTRAGLKLLKHAHHLKARLTGVSTDAEGHKTPFGESLTLRLAKAKTRAH